MTEEKISDMTEAEAREMAATKWWETSTPREIACFQIKQPRLCCPWGVYHEAMEKTLGRSIWTHEFGLNVEGLKKELFEGKAPPSFDEILNLIPESKRIGITL